VWTSKVLPIGLVILLSVTHSAAFAADQSVTDFLNAQLAKKALIKLQRTVLKEVTICHPSGHGNPDHCFTDTEDVVVPFEDHAKVTNSKIVSYTNLQYDTEHSVSLPFQPLLTRESYQNCGEGTTIDNTISLSVTGTYSASFTKTEGISTTIASSMSITGSYNYAGEDNHFFLEPYHLV
jgi:hypothetical protein